MEKKGLQTLRLWNPLFTKIYRKNEWGDTENEPEDMDTNEIVEYQEEILAAIEREKYSFYFKAGIVNVRREGKSMYYTINKQGFKTAKMFLMNLK